MFRNITPEQHNAFLNTLRSGQYNLLTGAGASMDSSNSFGNLPSGGAFKDDLCRIKDVPSNVSLSRIFGLLKPDEVEKYVTLRFLNSDPGRSSKLISSFIWKRIFTWNIDDNLENEYLLPDKRQSIKSIHFKDDFEEFDNLAEIPLIHLHGCVLYPEKGYVFSQSEYINQIKDIIPWMVILSQLLLSEPFIITGTSFDEIDLDYYLSFRDKESSREDRGPSIFVDKAVNAINDHICEKHNLIQFVGYTNDFLDYCKNLLPITPTPYDLIPRETQNLFPRTISKSAVVAFQSDFELVPGQAPAASLASRFLYGHLATWNDLSAETDISRTKTPFVLDQIQKSLSDSRHPQITLVCDTAGTGKSTILRRVSFELAKRGVRTLLCTATGTLGKSTGDLVDTLEGPTVFVVDNFADHVSSISGLLSQITKPDIAILAAERSYRLKYIDQVLAGTETTEIHGLSLRRPEDTRLIRLYINNALTGDTQIKKNPNAFSKQLIGDPIAVACCRIMNDFRPLERIIEELYENSSQTDLDRYLVLAIAQHCNRSGLRYEILCNASNRIQISEQFSKSSRLPITYTDHTHTHVIAENSTVCEQILDYAAKNDQALLLEKFVRLANALGPHVNRKMIIRRTPESKLSGRLFDYDDVVSKFLGEYSDEFYRRVEKAWRWNSRYWEQVALLNLTKFYSNNDPVAKAEYLENAVRRARHAVSLEEHPFPLSTLGKVLMASMGYVDHSRDTTFDEAYSRLIRAIDLESSWSRNAVHPYMSLFSGTLKFIELGGTMSDKQKINITNLVERASRRFSKEQDLMILISRLRVRI